MFYHHLDQTSALSLIEPRHAALLFALVDANREHLRAWLPWVDRTNDVGAVEAFIRHSLERFARNDGFDAALWHDGQLAGVVGYHAIDWANRSTSLGYWLGARFQGKGLMTAACRALVDHAFGAWGLNRVVIRCATGNQKSQAIPARLEFTLEGAAREAEWLGDRFVDLNVYSKLASAWSP